MKVTALMLLAIMLGGCGLQPVQPWQRGNFAKPEMAWDAGLAEESTIRDHTFVSKEAASGGAALGGGGCGCN